MSWQISTAITYNSQSARSLLNVLRQSLSERRHKPSSLSPILLFALAPSSTTPPEILSDITSSLTQFYPRHVGCISAPLPYRCGDSGGYGGPNSCSLAYTFVNAVSFRSTISGRAEAQVGRWHAARQRSEDTDRITRVNFGDSQARVFSDFFSSDSQVSWEDVWQRTASSVSGYGNGQASEALPETLRNLDPLSINNILYFSDKAPEGLANVLEGAFPQANKLSLIASSTPFITGRPVTLFYNGSILSDGAIGIALGSSASSPPPTVELSFPPLVVLSANLNVTSSEGNLILSLDSGNPTQILLSAIREHGVTSSHSTYVGKEDEFYVGVTDPLSQQVSQLHRINAGDPSRGAIALDGASAPREGSIVRLYHLPRDPVPGTLTYSPQNTPAISLFVAPETTLAARSREENADAPSDGDHSVVPNAFLAASENGFTLSRGAQGPWKCVVPGARTGLSWHDPK